MTLSPLYKSQDSAVHGWTPVAKDMSYGNALSVATNADSPPPVNLPSLHIMVVTETWLPDINGVASSMYAILQQLKQMGHRITLIRPSQGEQIEAERLSARANFMAVNEDKQVSSLPIPYYPHLRMGLPCYRFLYQQIRQCQPDIVHIVTEGPLGFAALMAAKRCGVKVSAGYHTAFHDFSRYFGLKVLAWPLLGYMKHFHNHCHATCVPSQTTEQQLSQFGFKRLYQVGRGVDTQKFSPTHRSLALREKWGAGDETTVLLYAGRVSPEKGIDTVIEGFKALQLAQLHRDVKLVIVGDGPDKARLESQYQGDDSIIFAGFQTGHILAVHYASCDAFVFASQIETFGNVVTEAMASGLPVFAYHDAAAALLVTPECGQTVTLGDNAAFIEMVRHLPKQQQLAKMRDKASEQVAGFSWQRAALQLLTMFYQVLGISTQPLNEALISTKSPKADVVTGNMVSPLVSPNASTKPALISQTMA